MGDEFFLRNQRDIVDMFMLSICICNDVLVVHHHTTNEKQYHGQSTDEITLLKMAEAVGYNMEERN